VPQDKYNCTNFKQLETKSICTSSAAGTDRRGQSRPFQKSSIFIIFSPFALILTEVTPLNWCPFDFIPAALCISGKKKMIRRVAKACDHAEYNGVYAGIIRCLY